MGIPADMQRFLTQKYNIMQQEADARTMGVKADANFAGIRGGAIMAATPSENALRTAQAGLLSTQASLAPEELASQNAYRRAQVSDIFASGLDRGVGVNDERNPNTIPEWARVSFGLRTADAFGARLRALGVGATP